MHYYLVDGFIYILSFYIFMFISSVSSTTPLTSFSVYIIQTNHTNGLHVKGLFCPIKKSYYIDKFSLKHQLRNFKKTYRMYVHFKMNNCFSQMFLIKLSIFP